MADRATILPLDADFHTIFAVSRAPEPSVIRLRMQRSRGPEVVEVVQHVLATFNVDLKRGCLVTGKTPTSL